MAIARTLFTAETLDLLDYQTNRQNAFQNVIGINNFKWELRCYLDNEKDLEELRIKNAMEVLVHLVDSNSDDVELIKKTLYAIESFDGITNKTKRTIGNLVMKAIYTINMPEKAIEVTLNEAMKTGFINILKLSMKFFPAL